MSNRRRSKRPQRLNSERADRAAEIARMEANVLTVLAQVPLIPREEFNRLVRKYLRSKRSLRMANLLMGNKVPNVTPEEREAVLNFERWVLSNWRLRVGSALGSSWKNYPEVPGITRLRDIAILATVAQAAIAQTREPESKFRAILARASSPRVVRIARAILGLPTAGTTPRDRSDAKICREWATMIQEIEQADETLSSHRYFASRD